MKNAQSNMSTSQWAKYNKITMKLAKAAQEMNENRMDKGQRGRDGNYIL